MNELAKKHSVPAHWADDRLGRHPLSLHMTRVLEARYSTYHGDPLSGALSVALDAEWGLGKTFFAHRWMMDLSNAQYATIHFDAWINDLSDDPLVAFLAVLSQQLKVLLKRLPPRQQLAGSRVLSKVVKIGGKAIVGGAVAFGKGAARHYGGSALSDAVATFTETIAHSKEPDAGALGEKAIDAMLETAMRSHRARRDAIDELKGQIAVLAEYFSTHGRFKLPIVIWVDELDRCRPDYAVRLLEGMKHLFDAHGVCFVVSTNLEQLGEAVKAIYGPGFDGYRYLKRFFNMEVALPKPTYLQFAEHLFSRSGLRDWKENWMIGLPFKPDEESQNDIDLLALAFSKVAEAGGLSARAQEKVFRQCESMLTVWPDDVFCVVSYVFSILALTEKDVRFLDVMESGETQQPFSVAMKPAMVIRQGQDREEHHDLRNILNRVHTLSKKPANEMRRVIDPRQGHYQNGDPFEREVQLRALRTPTCTVNGTEFTSLIRTMDVIRAAAFVK